MNRADLCHVRLNKIGLAAVGENHLGSGFLRVVLIAFWSGIGPNVRTHNPSAFMPKSDRNRPAYARADPGDNGNFLG